MDNDEYVNCSGNISYYTSSPSPSLSIHSSGYTDSLRYSGSTSSTSSYRGSYFISPQMLPKSEVRKKRVKAFFLKKKFIPIGYSSYTLKGKSVDEAYTILHNCGFKSIKKVEIKDIYVNSPYCENEIEKVEINGQSSYDSNSEFPYDADVIITIHKKREISIPFSVSSLKHLNYNEVCSRLSSLGFTEIYASPIKDLVTGWITKDGSVEKVVVNGSKSFKKNSIFKFDVTITVSYHTFKK